METFVPGPRGGYRLPRARRVVEGSVIAPLLVLWCAVPPALASAQPLRGTLEPRFETLRGSDELRESRILGIVRDHDGFLWFTTMSGLARYDGYEYRWFVSDPDDPHTLTDNRTRSLLVDHEGALWVGTWAGGLNRYDPQTGQFRRYRHDPSNPHSLSNDLVEVIYEDAEGRLWVGTHNGLNRLNRDTGGFDRYLYAPAPPSSAVDQDPAHPIYGLVGDGRGNLWIGEYGGGIRQFSNGETVARYRQAPGDPTSLSDDSIMALAMDGRRTLWIATWGGGLNAFDIEGESFKSYRNDPFDPSSLPGDQLMNVWVDGRDAVWVVALEGGLARLDRESDRFTRYPHDPGRVGSPSALVSGPADEDAEGALWLGTHGNGINVWHPAKPTLWHYRAGGGPNGLSDNYVLSVQEGAGGDVWAGTHNGLDRFDPVSETFTPYRHDPADPNSLSGNHVYAPHEDRERILWAGMWGSGLNRLDPRTGRVTRYPCSENPPHDPEALGGCDPRVIFEDSAGSLWVGTYRGLSRFDRGSGRFAHFAHDPADPSSLSHDVVTPCRGDSS